jgi:hypothetical protein
VRNAYFDHVAYLGHFGGEVVEQRAAEACEVGIAKAWGEHEVAVADVVG